MYKFLNILAISLISSQIIPKCLAEGTETFSFNAHIKCPEINKDSVSESYIQQDIPYTFKFQEDDKNFEAGLLHVEKAKAKRDIVLINMHQSHMPLNTEPAFKKDHRTLSWGTPYEAAVQQAMSALHHAHDQSALLKAWTAGDLRDSVSFVIIPKGAIMTFKIGYASSQEAKSEYRTGGGMQMRLANLPKGTIVLTTPLSHSGSKTTYPLVCLFEKALQQYNMRAPKQKLSSVLGDVDIGIADPKQYVDDTFEDYTINKG